MTTQEFNERQEKLTKESVHQFRVCKWLDQHDIVYFAVPNGYKKSKFQQAQAKREGLKSGVPDIIILTKTKDGYPVALEMKKYKGKNHKLPCNCLEEHQVEWKEKFIRAGWMHILAHGSEDAIATLEELYN